MLTFVPRPCIFLFAFGSTQSHIQLHVHRHTHTLADTYSHTHAHTLTRWDTHAFCFIYLPFCLISNLAHNFVFCCILCRVRLTRTHTRMHTARYLCVHSSLSLYVCVYWFGKRYLARLADCHFDPFGSGQVNEENSTRTVVEFAFSSLLCFPTPPPPSSLSLLSPLSISCFSSAWHKGKQAARKTKNNIATQSALLIQCTQAVCRQSLDVVDSLLRITKSVIGRQGELSVN